MLWLWNGEFEFTAVRSIAVHIYTILLEGVEVVLNGLSWIASIRVKCVRKLTGGHM